MAHESGDRRPFLDERVASVDFSSVTIILLMYNTVKEQVDKIQFIGGMDTVLATVTLKSPVGTEYRPDLSFEIIQYQLAGVFTGDLDFLANFLGQQGASAKWLCMFCLDSQDKLADTFLLGGNAARFNKRKGMNSIQKCFAVYEREYLNLHESQRTKAKKETVTKELSYSITGAPLADIPLDVIAPATMHVILGITKKLYDWLVKSFAMIETPEEKKLREKQRTTSVKLSRRP